MAKRISGKRPLDIPTFLKPEEMDFEKRYLRITQSPPGGSGTPMIHGNERHNPNFVAEATFNNHSARHEDGGADEISIAGLAGESANLSTHKSDLTAHNSLVWALVLGG